MNTNENMRNVFWGVVNGILKLALGPFGGSAAWEIAAIFPSKLASASSEQIVQSVGELCQGRAGGLNSLFRLNEKIMILLVVELNL